MDHLPLGDAAMLASAINFMIRDHEYEDLDDICNCFDADRKNVEEILSTAGYRYDESLKKVI